MGPSNKGPGRPSGSTKTDAEKRKADKARKTKKYHQKKQDFQQRQALRAHLQTATNDGDDNNTIANVPVAEEVLPERIEVDPRPIGTGRLSWGGGEDEEEGGDDDDDSTTWDIDDDDDGEELFEGLEPEGTMKEYLQGVFERLKRETTQDSNALQGKSTWLLDLLKQNDWRIPAKKAKYVCNKLAIPFKEPSYYRDIVVWLPDIQFGLDPNCPTCGCQCRFHSWQTGHFGRVVIQLYGHYYAISRRYICTNCKKTAKEQKDAALLAASEAVAKHGASIEPIDDDDIGSSDDDDSDEDGGAKDGLAPPPYTFMGYNPRSRELLPYGLGDRFPAFFTHKGAVDISIIDLMRPLRDVGVRPKQMADLLLELAAKEYHRQYLRREQDIRRKQKAPGQEDYKRDSLFSEFQDKNGYGALVPSGKYLSHVYKLYHKTIRPHLDREVKKRGAKYLRWDASFKEAKKLCRLSGKPVFKGLVTATNEIGEIRIQFHIVTDGHDQMVNAIREFQKTTIEYGQPQTEIVFSDKPSDDSGFFGEHLPGVDAKQQEFDALQLSEATIDTSEPFEQCEVDLDDVALTTKHREVDIKARGILDHLMGLPEGERVVALDTEYEYGSKTQYPPHGRDKIALIQLGYQTEDGNYKALLIKCRTFAKLPQNLVQLFRNTSILFVGSRIKGDIEKIGVDFGIQDVTSSMRYRELAAMAKDRGVINDARTGLEKLVLVVLRQQMDKDDNVRSSKWAVTTLSEKQKKYAALDAIKSLEVYRALLPLPDLSKRLTQQEAKAGVVTDVVAPHGKAGSGEMATVAAVGTILEREPWEPPQSEDYRIRRTVQTKRKPTRIVEVTKVFAPGLAIPEYKREDRSGNSRPVTLRDFATSTPFRVELPLTMLKQHDPEIDSRNEAASYETVGNGTARWERLDDPDATGTGGVDEIDELASGERPNMSKKEIAEVQHVLTISKECRNIDTDHKLDKPPQTITDQYRSVLGDAFHAMDRPKVPVKHEYKKPYYVAFQEAFLAWDPVKLEEVKGVLRKSGMTAEQVEAKMYYDVDFFIECVPREVLPPSLLYWRVRSVFATYGPKIDSVTQRPLFNDRAWKKANNLLKEILEGFYSDPPGVPMYMQKLDDRGEPRTNQYGLPTYWCLRGTGLTETAHKQMLMSIGTWCTGIEEADALRAEQRHRYNHRMSERRRAGFPRIGHYDTWLVDALQILVEHNHNVLLYTTWTNSSDVYDTPEGFGTVPLQSNELTDKVNRLKITPKLTREQRYLAEQQGVKLPFTPVVYVEEKKLVRKMILEESDLDVESMALKWIEHVDGKRIFPKLGVYLRTYLDHHLRNRRIEDAMKNMEDEIRRLQSINESLLPYNGEDDNNGEEDLTMVGDGNASNNEQQYPPMDDQMVVGQQDDDEQVVAGQDSPDPNAVRHWHPPIPPPVLAPGPNITPRSLRFVGGTQVGISSMNNLVAMQQKRRGERSQDRGKRRPRTCKRCKANNGENAAICQGRAPNYGQNGCQYFDEHGNPLL